MATLDTVISDTKAKLVEVKEAAQEASAAVKEIISAMEKAEIMFEKLKSYCPKELPDIAEQ